MKKREKQGSGSLITLLKVIHLASGLKFKPNSTNSTASSHFSEIELGPCSTETLWPLVFPKVNVTRPMGPSETSPRIVVISSKSSVSQLIRSRNVENKLNWTLLLEVFVMVLM